LARSLLGRPTADGVKSSVQTYEITGKVGFCGANISTYYGGIHRRGNAHVITKLKDRLERGIAGTGCNAQIVHNCLQSACDTLPIEAEGLVVKIYNIHIPLFVLLNYSV
jgi:hypothetical protein